MKKRLRLIEKAALFTVTVLVHFVVVPVVMLYFGVSQAIKDIRARG